MSLDNELSIFPKVLRRIARKEFGFDLPDSLKIGRFSKMEDDIILLNWGKLLKEANLETQEDLLGKVFSSSNSKKEDQIKNLIGYRVSQGLTHARIACEVFNRLNILCNTTGGHFSAKEDQILRQHVQKHGRNWRALSEETGRNSSALIYRYDNYIKANQNASKKLNSGKYSIEEDQHIIEVVLSQHPHAVEENINIRFKDKVWSELGSDLRRYPMLIRKHWFDMLLPLLVRYRAGTLDTDYTEQVVNYMVRNNLDYCQDVDWNSLSELIPGSTAKHLQIVYKIIYISTMRKYKLKTAEVTSKTLKKYLDEKNTYHDRARTSKKNEALLLFYEKLLNCKH